MDAQAQRNEAARKLGAGLADILSAVTVGVPLGTLADKSVEYLQKQFAANKAALEGDDAARRAARDLAQAAFRKPIAPGRLRRGSEATLLRAERGIVPFSGREAELAEFAAWFDDAEPMRWRLLTGPSGRGKTRFMQHVVETYGAARGDRLLAGFVDLDAIARTPEALAGFLAHEGEVLLVVDYAERARAQTTAILKLALMLETAADAGADLKVRVVLIARGLSEVWQQIGVEHGEIGEVMNSTEGLFDTVDLPPLVDTPEARREEFARAFAAFDKAINPDASADGRAPAADRVPALVPVPPRDDFREAVTIHLAALAAVQGAMRAREMTDTRLLDWIVDRERREWGRRASAVLPLPEAVRGKALDEAVGAVTLGAAASQEPSVARVTDLLAACPRLKECSRGQREALAGLLDDLYPGESGPVGLTPDLLGTYFLGLLDPDLFAALFAVLDEQEATNGLTKLNWLAQNWKNPEERANPVGVERIQAAIAGNAGLTLPVVIDVAQQSGDPIGVIAAQVIEQTNDVALAMHLEESRGFPEQTVALRELAVAAETILFKAEAADESEESRNRRARRANNLSVRLSALGRDEEALIAAEQAVALRRVLAAAKPDAFISDLASSLNNLSNYLSNLGRREDALEASEEATSHRRDLMAKDRDAFAADLAISLNNLSNHLYALGRFDGAFAAIEEAVNLYRSLVSASPDVFTPKLAMALSNLAGCHSDLGRREMALSTIEEAMKHYRNLADTRPDEFLPVLGESLNSLSNHLSDCGQLHDALMAVEEAVEVLRPLAVARPSAFNPNLASALNNLSNRLSGLGRNEQALRTIEEAVDLRRELVATRPETFTPDLAESLNNLSIRLSSLGLSEEAAAASQEAVAFYRKLSGTRPEVFKSDLARSLNNLSIWLCHLGRPQDALTAIEEAVEIRRVMAELQPDAFNPDLAGSLNTLSNTLSDLGRRDEALAIIEEAISLRRKLLEIQPAAFAPALAISLGTRGEILSADDQNDLAAQSFAEGLFILYDRFRLLPLAFEGLITSLLRDYLGACDSANVQPDHALIDPLRCVLVDSGFDDPFDSRPAP